MTAVLDDSLPLAARSLPTRARIAALCIAACSFACQDAPEAKRPNVLLISIDSLRADHLGCYGYERDTSPSIDRLAREGALFERVSSSTSWTLPSHAALFTALPDSVHGCDRTSRVLPPSRDTLAEALSAEGYYTAGFWSGPYLHPRFGLAQGFDEYTSCAGYEVFSDANIRAGTTSGPGGSPAGQFRANRLSHEDVTSPALSSSVDRFLREHAKEPFFLFVHMWDVHYDFIPPEAYATRFDPDYQGTVDGRGLSGDFQLPEGPAGQRDREHLIALYDGEIAWTDHHVGKMLDLLDELGLAEDTIVVLTADHGEEFFEHGLFGHRKTLYEEVLHIPLVVRYPREIEGGTRHTELGRIVDVAPTILELAGARRLKDTLGESLVNESESGAERLAISELVKLRAGNDLLAVRSSQWKLIVDREDGDAIGLWNLEVDPTEQTNLLGRDEALLSTAVEASDSLRARLAQLARSHSLEGSEAGGALPPELEQNLRQLGYLGGEPEDE